MVNKAGFDIAKLRWGVPLLFVIGYFLTEERFVFFGFAPDEYLIYNLFALGTSVVLIAQLKGWEQRSVAVWMALIIFLTVYFLRFYWIAIDPLPVKVMLPLNPYLIMVGRKSELIDAFRLSVIAFTTFGLSSAAMLYLLRKQNIPTYQDVFHSDIRTHMLVTKLSLILLVPLVLVLSYVSYKYHIGEMGAASGEALPFRLKGVVFYVRIVFVPLLILLLIYSAERSGHVVMSRLGILLLMANGVLDMLLRSSRSSLLLSILLLIFLVLAGGVKLRRSEKALIGITVMLAFITVPVVTTYRFQRVYGGLLAIDALKYAIFALGDNWWGAVLQGIKFVLFRMPGVESIWCMLVEGARPLGIQSLEVLRSVNGMAGYLTFNIYTLKLENNTLLAPSFVGWFYLVAGLPAVAFGGIFAAVLSVFGWKFLDHRYLECGPVAQAFFLWMLFVALTEGTLDTMRYMILAGIACVIGIELSLRLIKASFFRQESHKKLT